MFRGLVFAVALWGCSSPPKKPPGKPVVAGDVDPDGPHREAIAAQVKPYLDGELVTGLVIGIYDAGKLEIYGFGAGPGGKPPNGHTLFELGSITGVYTNLMLADSVQKREVEIDAPVTELLPPGVTVPTANKVAITLKHLALHSSGLPHNPPSLLARKMPPDPYASYGEDALFQDLIATQLDAPPGTQIAQSDYGTGLLGYALGRKIGGGFAKAVEARVLVPLGLRETFVNVPAGFGARRALGTDEDLKQTSRWTWGALAGAGILSSTVRDQLKLIDAELDAAAGSRGTLRGPMRYSQETELDTAGENAGLGWTIDSAGRYFHAGLTGGFRGFVGFDPKTKRGVVVLASTSTTLIDSLARSMFDVLDGTVKPAAALPTEARLATYAGLYDFGGAKLTIVVQGKRIYVEGPGEPRHRLAPINDRTFWIEAVQTAARFEIEGDVIKALVFKVGDRVIAAPRVP
jgi:CubicO group peptidase (beta-lactamase class C family)